MLKIRHLFVALAFACTTAGRAAAPAPVPAPAQSPATMPAPSAPVAHALERADLEAWLDGFLPYALERGDVAGAVVSVVKDGEIIFAKGYGYSDVAKRTPVDPDLTLFRPGSVSKLFTWTAVMQLVEAGKLDLDKDVNEYLDFKLPERSDGPITLRDILTHTPGFEEKIKTLIIEDPKAFVDLGTYLKRGTPTRIYKAGSTPAYSNYATAVAGYIVERVSGQSFDDYLDSHIFKPLGMEHASFRQPLPEALLKDAAQGYAEASLPAKPYELVVAAPAGSLAASGTDMARFMIAHLQNGEFHGNRILSAETAKMMHETTLTMIPPLNRMALGFYEQNFNGHRVISHGGDTQFMHSYLHLLLDDHVGVFISVNSAGREGAAGAIRGALFDNFFDRYFPAPRSTARVDDKTAAEHAALVAGTYDDSRRADMSFMSLLGLASPVKIVANPDHTISAPLLKGRNGANRKYHEVAPFLWQDDTGWRMAAKTENGRVARLSLDEISPFMIFEPSPTWRSAAWLAPAGLVSLLAVLFTTILWPVAAITRRRLGVKIELTGRAARGRLVSRQAALAVAGICVTWLTVLGVGMTHMGLLAPSFDPVIYLMSALSVVCFVGGAAALWWSAYVAFADGRPWTARLWTTVLALSATVLLWIAFVYHLMSFNANY